jgi:3-amino-4-hydroxybenzoic acid synthase
VTTAWIDIRNYKSDAIADIVEVAVGHQIEAIVTDADADARIGARAPSIQWVTFDEVRNGSISNIASSDLCVHSLDGHASDLLASSLLRVSKKDGVLIDVADKDTLNDACTAVRAGMLTVIRFKDPTKIPLEIVLAAGSRRGAKIMTFVSDLDEASVVMSVLESGPDGVIMTPRSTADVEALGQLCSPPRPRLELKEFSVTEIANAGTGDRVCVDTCSNFHLDEGLLVGTFGGGFLLCCSETHPLPYMPTRPFRVNAGAVSCYILSTPNRTNYLSELCQGDTVTGVDVNGNTRPLVVGRSKIETRPLLLIKAQSADGDTASVILQNDWHVRVLGTGGAVLNITELKAGSVILGHTAARARHVGMAVDEYCVEK